MPGQPPTEAIARTVAAIAPPDQAAAARAAERQGRLTKPPGSLGRLESLETRIAGITGVDRPRLKQRLLVVAAGDHGVAAQDVSAYPQSVTAQMVANFAAGGAAVNVLADHAGARVHVVDAGVAEETSAALGLTRLRLAPGTDDITVGPAMTRELAERAIVAGIELFESESSLFEYAPVVRFFPSACGQKVRQEEGLLPRRPYGIHVGEEARVCRVDQAGLVRVRRHDEDFDAQAFQRLLERFPLRDGALAIDPAARAPARARVRIGTALHAEMRRVSHQHPPTLQSIPPPAPSISG